jgi:hypothetical protein
LYGIEMAVMVEQRHLKPFKTSEEYLMAMKEDLAEWLDHLYPELGIRADNFWESLGNGVALCAHANNVREYAKKYLELESKKEPGPAERVLKYPPVRRFEDAKQGTFFARDNVSNFISWCRKALGIIECLLFETEDLITLKNEKHVILCLLELARKGAKLGMPAPMLVLMEQEIDKEMAQTENGEEETEIIVENTREEVRTDSATRQIVTNDLKSLDDMVRVQVEMCKCPTQFPMIRVSEGKYRIGDTKVLIFVRLLRKHVMVRVGGGWDTLPHYLDKHDPCRCRNSHKSSLSAKLSGLKTGGPTVELGHAKVQYERKQQESQPKKDPLHHSWGAQPYCPPLPHNSPTH